MRQVIGVIRIVVLMTFGVWCLLMAWTRFRWKDAEGKGRMLLWYNKKLLYLCGLKYKSVGHLPKSVTEYGLTKEPPGIAAVCNHISFLDIFTLQASCGARFIAKSEIKKWPMFGDIATGIGTIYIERKSRKAILKVNEDIKHVLEKREGVGIFAEGTTSYGSTLLPIRSNFFKPVCELGAMVYPMVIVYTSYGVPCERYAFSGRMPVFKALWNVVTTPGGEATIHFLEPFSAKGMERHEVGRRCEEVMRAAVKKAWGDKYIESDPRVNKFISELMDNK